MADDGLDIDLTSHNSFSEIVSVQRWRASELRERTRRHVAMTLVGLYAVSNLFVLSLLAALTYSAAPQDRVEVVRQLLIGAGAYFGGSTALLAVVLRYYFKRD